MKQFISFGKPSLCICYLLLSVALQFSFYIAKGQTVTSLPYYVDSRNFVQTIAYDGNGNVAGQAVVFSDLLGRTTQTQSRNITSNTVMVTQKVYDRLGRPAIQTLAAPVTKDNMNYVTGFITNSSNKEYSYADFGDGYANSIAGKLADYYSDTNTPEPYVPASAYPYTRVDYSKLQPGVVRKTAAAGDYHRLGSGRETQFYTMQVPESELSGFSSLFSALAGVKLETKGIVKTVSIDADRNMGITYTSASGQTIAACHADGDAAPQTVTYPLATYCDVYLDRDQDVTINQATCLVYDLTTDAALSSERFTGTVSLVQGFYRFVQSDESTTQANITYTLGYKGYSFNFYDNAGRLIYGLSPQGFADWQNEGNKTDENFKKYATYNEYNSLGWLLSTQSPDEGLVRYKYATDGKIRFSQNAKQLAANKFSYTNYDASDRPVESGEYAGSFNDADVTASIAGGTQWNRTFYDYTSDAVTYNGSSPNFTNGRVAKTQNENTTTVLQLYL